MDIEWKSLFLMISTLSEPVWMPRNSRRSKWFLPASSFRRLRKPFAPSRRSIYHRLEDRSRAYMFFCVRAYYTEQEMRNRLRPPLLDDESDSMEDGQGRDSAVQPAKISSKALLEVPRTAQGEPVHGFRTASMTWRLSTCNMIEPVFL